MLTAQPIGFTVTVYDGSAVEPVCAAGTATFNQALQAVTFMIDQHIGYKAVVESISADDFSIVFNFPLWISNEKIFELAPDTKFRYTFSACADEPRAPFESLRRLVIIFARVYTDQRTTAVTEYVEQELELPCI